MAYISKISIPNKGEFLIKDSEARSLIAGNKKLIEGLTPGFKIQVLAKEDSLPTPSAELVNTLVLMPADDATGTYVEYIYYKEGLEYKNEQIGTTKADLTNYVTKGSYNISGSCSPKGNVSTTINHNEKEPITLSGSIIPGVQLTGGVTASLGGNVITSVSTTAEDKVSVNKGYSTSSAKFPVYQVSDPTIESSGTKNITNTKPNFSVDGEVLSLSFTDDNSQSVNTSYALTNSAISVKTEGVWPTASTESVLKSVTATPSKPAINVGNTLKVSGTSTAVSVKGSYDKVTGASSTFTGTSTTVSGSVDLSK